ncbi:MAG: DUF4440 domain-containing protein [Maritimibacter sp.]|nr:DUF4440 domain-containing protein [Maritimibacter sp.]
MSTIARDPLSHTSPWALEEHFWLEGPNFYRAHLSKDAAMWFPDRPEPLRGEAILDGLMNAPRWESVVLDQQDMAVTDETVTLRYHATARRDGQDDYRAACTTVYKRDAGGLKLLEHHQRIA